MLVSCGADVNAKDKEGTTPLYYAMEWHQSPFTNYDIIEFLVSKGADVNAKKGNGMTPLLYAMSPSFPSVYKEDNDIIWLFLTNGADVNAQGSHGETPLHNVACWPSYCYPASDCVETAKCLVSEGADVNAKDREGKTPLDRATESGNSAMAEYISEHVCKNAK